MATTALFLFNKEGGNKRGSFPLFLPSLVKRKEKGQKPLTRLAEGDSPAPPPLADCEKLGLIRRLNQAIQKA